MFIEVHMIQSFAPSNLNRDDTNNPKDCEFGGVRRARISSQCIKREIRNSPEFIKATQADNGKRTRWIIKYIKPLLMEAEKPEGEVDTVLQVFVRKLVGRYDKDELEKSNAAAYLSKFEREAIVEVLLDNWELLLSTAERLGVDALQERINKDGDLKKIVKAVEKLLKNGGAYITTSAPDIALFGRMLANNPELGMDAACQVAHAISTHRITMEMDYFTAVDDLQERDEPGAGMIGFTGFNSATFYRYARIDWKQLVQNLSGDEELARQAVEGFLRASVEAVPTGKQNSFAAQNPPDFLLAVTREDGQSWSLANAFETPVRAEREGGLVRPSVQALDHYWGRLQRAYGNGNLAAVSALALNEEPPVENLQAALVENLDAWVGTVLAALPTEGAAG